MCSIESMFSTESMKGVQGHGGISKGLPTQRGQENHGQRGHKLGAPYAEGSKVLLLHIDAGDASDVMYHGEADHVATGTRSVTSKGMRRWRHRCCKWEAWGLRASAKDIRGADGDASPEDGKAAIPDGVASGVLLTSG
ncbi:hypothetical protein Taro_003279 [Colocasia esculenta]|uniref:Uncharacterized protein n=1 Tax=Colocasia esculenta TaxID=4460 RepID=A0A843TNL6_COLES|nr:hypothetical protein [Colocasia esculenta]